MEQIAGPCIGRFADVDVADWRLDDEYGVYPEGARDKSLIIAPTQLSSNLLVPKHRYLFKRANPRYQDQFWAEIIAYQIGLHMGVDVPPAFVGWNSHTADCGALIEWFIGRQGVPEENYVPGGDYLTRMISGYDRQKGSQHNIDSIIQLMDELQDGENLVDYRKWWCKTFLFDALIGNTDRHQDNWGLLQSLDGALRMAPVFDNGTSLGHEIFVADMHKFDDAANINRYISRGHHHVRWTLGSDMRAQHFKLIRELCEERWGLRDYVRELLASFNPDQIWATIQSMTEVNIPVSLSRDRARFANMVIRARYEALNRD